MIWFWVGAGCAALLAGALGFVIGRIFGHVDATVEMRKIAQAGDRQGRHEFGLHIRRAIAKIESLPVW